MQHNKEENWESIKIRFRGQHIDSELIYCSNERKPTLPALLQNAVHVNLASPIPGIR